MFKFGSESRISQKGNGDELGTKLWFALMMIRNFSDRCIRGVSTVELEF